MPSRSCSRFGTVAPDGTAWARIAKQTGVALAEATGGQVTSKWYFGGIAGDELQMLERMRKDQLDAHRLGRHAVRAALAVDARAAHGRAVPDAATSRPTSPGA